ncbi:DUF6084 family protein [Nonomuraea sp. NPDC050691]|uniref:DUF6084 family protein n=1 Tax=Nonomuraea sp. NPDC050691 TaxID=3155661 RepID=UPI00340370E8
MTAPRGPAASRDTTTPQDPAAGGVPALRVTVEGVQAAEFAAVPTLEFALRVSGADGAEVRSVVLETQLRIAVTRRSYDEASRERLADLFGPPELWARRPASLLWAQIVTQVPAFTGETTALLRVPCTYDFDVAAAKYLDGVRDGEIPLEFLFSGTVFSLAGGMLRATRIPWDTEAGFRMPAATWRDLMDRYFPGAAWLRLGRDTFDRLHAYRTRNALPGWDDVVESLLKAGADGRR